MQSRSRCLSASAPSLHHSLDFADGFTGNASLAFRLEGNSQDRLDVNRSRGNEALREFWRLCAPLYHRSPYDPQSDAHTIWNPRLKAHLWLGGELKEPVFTGVGLASVISATPTMLP